LQCRGFVDGTDKLQFTTDSRSQKAGNHTHPCLCLLCSCVTIPIACAWRWQRPVWMLYGTDWRNEALPIWWGILILRIIVFLWGNGWSLSYLYPLNHELERLLWKFKGCSSRVTLFPIYCCKKSNQIMKERLLLTRWRWLADLLLLHWDMGAVPSQWHFGPYWQHRIGSFKENC
jgi:hypothetical protein